LEKGSYTRLPGFGGVNRYDVVVFNYPSGDTAVYDPRMPNGLMGHDYHGIVINEAKRLYMKQFDVQVNNLAFQISDSIRKSNPTQQYDELALQNYANNQASYRVLNEKAEGFVKEIEAWKNKARKMLAEDKIAMDNSEGRIIEHYGLVYRPVDKRENYIKRCVGIPGDWIEIKKLEYDDNSQDVTLVNKTPLIAKVNNGSLKLINNERYVIKKVVVPSDSMKSSTSKNTREIIINNDRNEIKIKADEFQKLFRIGYAFTTHSAQGMSIDKPYTIHEFNRMSKKLKYVSLSRSTKHEYINVM
jgi:signal peptidase I